MSERDDKLRWFVPLSDAEVEALIAGERAAAWRMAGAIVPVLLVIWWPMRAWLTLVVADRPRAITLCAVVSGFCPLAPLTFLSQAALLRWRSRRPLGTTYRVNDHRIRWGDKRMASWSNFVAWRDDGVARDGDGRDRVTLVRTGGRTHAMPLSGDPPVAAEMRRMLTARLPRYDPSLHGPIDLPAALPGWAVALLVLLGVAYVAAAEWTGARSAARVRDLADIYLATPFVPLAIATAWYCAVRGPLNGAQRERAGSFAVASILALWIAALSALLLPEAVRVARELRTIPPDVRARVDVTIPSEPRRH